MKITLVLSFLTVILYSFAITDGFSQEITPTPFGCCEFQDGFCSNINAPLGIEVCENNGGQVFPNSFCDDPFEGCQLVNPVRSIPTLSEWGLVAIAGVFGLIGFLVLRRAKA